jgi:ATP-dependent Clp protease ATP-binding subunit ClpC
VFERFTERARQVVVLAQEEARSPALKHNYIGTEHLLLGLLREQDGLAACVLASLGITAERVRRQLIRIVGAGEEVTSAGVSHPASHPPLKASPDAAGPPPSLFDSRCF